MTKNVHEWYEAYRSLFDYNPDASYAIDPEGRFLLANRAATEMIGYAKEELAGKPFTLLIPEKDLDRVMAAFRKTLTGTPQQMELTLLHKDGHAIEVLVTAAPIVASGHTCGVIGISKNMTESNRVHRELSEFRNQLQNIFANLDILVWSYDVKEKKCIYVSSACEQIYGVTVEQYVQPDFWKSVIHPDDLGRVEASQIDLRAGKTLHNEYRIFHANGEIRWIEDNAMPVLDASGELIRLEGVVTDITERKKIEERLHHMAFHDSLTGLPNRLLFKEKLEAAIARAKANGEKAAVLYLDLDRFKLINDSLGHDVGDQLLQVIARRLKDVLHPDDVVSRQGGDEFAIVLNGMRNQEHIYRRVRRILDTFQRPVKLFHLELMVTTSIGVSVYPDAGTDTATLLKQADQAMYLAKEKGKNNFQSFSPKLDETLARKMFLEQSLHHALKNDELLLHYQPIVDAATCGLHGFEALLRWVHPTLGFVSPAELIPIAEETGLIVPIGEWVLRTACLQTKIWQSKGFPHLGVSVNISALQLMENFIPVVEKALLQTRLAPGSLTLEITESTAMQSVADIISKIGQLRELGVKLSIDDFGTGYSSLSYLKKFQIHALKIDQSFVRDIEKDTNQEAIIKAVIAMADSLRIGVVAEGVETEEQIRFLRSFGCGRMQGYYFSRPLSIEQAETLYFCGSKLP
ncbi:EAL domain-containing protein [Cohnella sp. CFH 77786]|uniref:putative bifunctional diguanylate cyclase/phosphodiesterase n=1 Tax=Cohnella sp. CFH 77786 TaxID=2662265 RepID=UPI001C60FD14|nr:EAL domain-containing protein [Cohnella sp. CFH 77786]MBW5446883.1 EAL domain-containing protein [Cohnella sp. CFH 77786]